MREIKFRGKDLLNKWRYGDLIQEKRKIQVKKLVQDKWKITSIKNEKVYMIKKDKTAWTVKEETIGQFTGLKDKNEKEIYEGDIVRVFVLGEYTKGYVKYNENKGRFDIGWKTEVEKYKNNEYVGSCSCMTNEYDLLEVIGNIHDNPELLKESE